VLFLKVTYEHFLTKDPTNNLIRTQYTIIFCLRARQMHRMKNVSSLQFTRTLYRPATFLADCKRRIGLEEKWSMTNYEKLIETWSRGRSVQTVGKLMETWSGIWSEGRIVHDKLWETH
jgi:hypothetical protein